MANWVNGNLMTVLPENHHGLEDEDNDGPYRGIPVEDY
jgi:hypothetical protein